MVPALGWGGMGVALTLADAASRPQLSCSLMNQVVLELQSRGSSPCFTDEK